MGEGEGRSAGMADGFHGMPYTTRWDLDVGRGPDKA
jgi:hypothetical protein